ncbi:hypothetical protein P9D47_20900 [Bacillus haynesii]|uniref:hypothetical protein n=1 Tax=Bacillus haynesii TaxID=1925021 RepID=UPI00159357DE|nr:hypothetical protein [Bacillus haynesii]MEC1470475.1 hypothetical protein [Bacillus haynesii]NVB36108.1 hypothetical protein [Bacillus licheniformis]
MSKFATDKEMDSFRKKYMKENQYKLYSGLKKEFNLTDRQVIGMTWGELDKLINKKN